MSCVYKISTQDKKSICQEEIFERVVNGVTQRVTMEQWWRWGYVIISGVEKDEIDPTNPNGLLVSDYSIEDQGFDDGVALWFNYSDNVTDEEKEQFEAAWDENGYEGIEELDWSQWDTETTFIGPLEIELLEEIEEEEEEDSPKGTWPY
jgi:hypothetical protein